MTTDDRRKALRMANTVNGVDFVEVDPTDETKLVVHFVLNLPDAPTDPVPPDPGDALGPNNFRITGGERITGITVAGATRIANDQMQVIVKQVGDFSAYTLTVQATPTQQTPMPGVPPGFDPASASANFVFHIDCAHDFDCSATTACPTDAVAPPPINYLVKDYPGFVRVMLDRLSLLAPDWQERNPADLGVAIVEMLAYVGDQLSYRQDVIATEAYLGTARLRTSVRRHARLVDYHLGEGANARAWLRVLLSSATADGAVLPAGTRCATWFPGATAPTVAHESLAYQQAINAGAVFFETVTLPAAPSTGAGPPPTAPVTTPLYFEHAQMPLYAWSDLQACLAVGVTHATLDGPFPNLAAGMVVILAEVVGPLTGAAADANPAHRQAVRLVDVAVTTDPMNNRPITEIDWHVEDALTFVLCVASISDSAHGEKPVSGVSVAWGNIVLADQGRDVGGPTDPMVTGPEPIGVVPAPGEGRFRPHLANAGLTFAAAIPDASEPAIAAITPPDTPRAVVALQSVDVDNNTANWSATEDLLDAQTGPTTTVFVPEMETDGTAYLLFGDGINGLAPQPGTSFTAQYRVGNGTAGNVARDAITLFDPTGVPVGVSGITNPLPAWGGADPETIDHVRQSAPVAFRTQERAVTPSDYQARAATYPGVQRAAATLRWTGSWHTVFLTIERDQQAALDPGFIAGLEAYLDGYRMAGVDLEVEDGIQVPLLVQMSVCVQPSYVAADVEQALLAMFSAGLQADGTLGLFNPARLNLGQPLYASPLVAAAQAVEGVASVQLLAFERQDRPGDEGLVAGVLTPQPLEFFVLDNDPNFPERGRFVLTVGGGL